MKWIKASERLPDEERPAKLHGIQYGKIRVKDNFVEFLAWQIAHSYTFKSLELKNIEWLDESPTPEDRMFTLEEMKDTWEAAVDYEFDINYGHIPTKRPDKKNYFKEKLNIDL
jgi:hypothetical protein